MKRFFLGLLAVLQCIICCGCSDFQQALQQHLAAPSTIVLVTTQPAQEFAGLDLSAFEATNTATAPCQYRVVRTTDPAAQLDALRSAAADPATAVLIAELVGGTYADAVVDIARQYALPLLLCGVRPAQKVLESYENCWYVGFDPLLASELQAQILVKAFHDELLVDQTGDYKQSGLVVSTMAGYNYQPAGYAARLLHDMELGGIHTTAAADPVLAADEAALYQQLHALLLPQTQIIQWETEEDGGFVTHTQEEILPAALQTEYIFCADVAASDAAIKLVADLHAAAADEALAEFAAPARNYALVCFGSSDAIRAGLENGTVWGTVVRDTAAATDALLALGTNLALGYSPTKDTDYHLQDGKCLMLDYNTLYTTAKEQP